MIFAASLLFSTAAVNATGLDTFSLTPKVSVDGKGAATAQLPLKVPAAPMAPKLSLSYNSQSGGNYLGQGWMLQGPTAIQLTGLNKRLDNTWSNIALDSEDLGYSQSNRYSLNGVRLVNIKGDYGKPDTEYQTTLKATHKIISHGTCGNGPCTFDVYEANGTVSHYASNISPGGEDVLVWGLTSQTDTHGNRITWEYENPKDYNVLYPRSVTYGKDGAMRKIAFRYRKKHREVEVPAHIGLGGYVFHADLLLVGIDAYLNDKRLYTYNLDYTEYDYYRHSLLTNVTLCAASGECYSPLTMRYDAPTPGTQPHVAFTPNGELDMGQAPSSPEELRVLIWDKYGDGYPGIGLLTNVNGRAMFTFARSREDGTLYRASDREDLGDWSSDDAGKHPYSWFVMDTNGDGLNDLVKVHKGRADETLATVYEAQTGLSGFVGQSRDTHLDNVWKDDRRFYTTDVNGDGRRD
ncbi:SpvB/TcaC N-terminal domain-containing protein, partial [Thiolapillus sp.]|uniref:SpvB/TcaC N-terminal domain-containing protein n=1 Tax=Thiolapillus sp. TaxID=2017437 RepID=UPI003AF7EB7B